MLLSVVMCDLFVSCDMILVEFHYTGTTFKENGKNNIEDSE